MDDVLTQAAARVVAARDGGVTTAVRERATLCVMHYLTCALNGLDLPWSRAVAGLAHPVTPASPATMIGAPEGVHGSDAVFANAVFGQSTLAEDVHLPSLAHPGSMVIPAALAAAEQAAASGTALLSAVAAGYDVLCGIGTALKTRAFTERGFRPSGVFGPLGAAAAVSAVLGADQATTASALGIAGNTSAGLREWAHTGSTDVYVHNGFAARNGYLAAQLAGQGISGPPSVLTGAHGMATAYAGGEVDWAQARRSWTSPGALAEISFKRYPVCSGVQAVLELAVAVRRRRIPPQHIDSVTVFTHRHGKTNPGCDHPGPFHGVSQAQMSNQLAVALALSGRRPDVAGFADHDQPEVADLARRVIVVEDETYTRRYPERSSARLEVRRADGSTVVEELDDATSLSDAEVIAGFRDAANARLPESAATALMDQASRLDSAATIAGLVHVLRKVETPDARRS